MPLQGQGVALVVQQAVVDLDLGHADARAQIGLHRAGDREVVIAVEVDAERLDLAAVAVEHAAGVVRTPSTSWLR
jgi:hypothetical protein